MVINTYEEQMSIRESSPMSRTSIAVVVVLLCAAGYAYMQGWFNRSRPGTEIESDKISANQAVEQQNITKDAAQPTEPVPAPKL
jgi:hypothetical protein